MQGFFLGQLSVVLLFGAFIKFFIFGDASSAAQSRLEGHRPGLAREGSFRATPATGEVSTRKKQASLLRKPPTLTTATILEKTYYNVNSHLPESVDWFNVLFAQTIAQFRSDAQHNDAILGSLNAMFNGSKKPDFLDDIRITELSLGEDFPIFSNCRIIPVDEEGDGSTAQARVEGGRLQARMDVDLSDFITLGVETKLVLNYPRPLVAVLPVALTVSVIRFTGTVRHPKRSHPSAAADPELALRFVHPLVTFRLVPYNAGLLILGRLPAGTFHEFSCWLTQPPPRCAQDSADHRGTPTRLVR